MQTARFSPLSGASLGEVATHDLLYNPYAAWLSAGHDLICRFSLSYQPSYFAPELARSMLSNMTQRLVSRAWWQRVYSPEELDSDRVRRAYSEIQYHAAMHTEGFFEMEKELSELSEKGEVFQADHYASDFIDSLLAAYNQLAFVRRGMRPSSKSQTG